MVSSSDRPRAHLSTVKMFYFAVAILLLCWFSKSGRVIAAPAAGGHLAARGPYRTKEVIVQMFEWSWDSIALECKNIGDAGFGFVQGV